MIYKIDFWVSYYYGAYTLRFRKEIEMPCAPFFGMWIIEEDEDTDTHYELVNNDYTQTLICYNLKSGQFEINVRNSWTRGVDSDYLDSTIETHDRFRWEREDSTNIEELKNLMDRMK